MYLILIVHRAPLTHIAASTSNPYAPDVNFTILLNELIYATTGKADHYRNVMNLPKLSSDIAQVRDMYEHSDSYVGPIDRMAHCFASKFGEIYLFHTVESKK